MAIEWAMSQLPAAANQKRKKGNENRKIVTEEKKHKKSSARKKGGRVGEPKCQTQVSTAWRCTLFCKKSISMKLDFITYFLLI